MSDSSDDQYFPDFEVWNHLESGWQLAYDDVAQKLPDATVALYRGIAQTIVGARSSLVFDVSDPKLSKSLSTALPGIAPTEHADAVDALIRWYQLKRDNWLTHFVHLEIAEDGVGRATRALSRFDHLAAQMTSQPVSPKVRPYIREVVSSYLFGSDAATIALARGTLEQLCRDTLLRLGQFTEARLRREKPSLETMMNELKRADALILSYDAADRIRERGNTVLHLHSYEERIRGQLASDSVTDLAAVLFELLP